MSEAWKEIVRFKTGHAHKYDYGSVLIYGGPEMTGAASLAAKAALRMGAGLVSILADPKVSNVYRSFCPSIIVRELDAVRHFSKHFNEKQTVLLIGSGAGQDDADGLRKAVLDAVKSGKISVIDADAMTVFSDDPDQLTNALNDRCILTPHEGEFKKLFPRIEGSKSEMAVSAAKASGAVIVLKGAETVMAHPNGRYEVYSDGSPWLATAGTGDVLAGMIAGLAAYHQDVLFEAVCAAVHMHGMASKIAGAGMISEDLPDILPLVWNAL